MKSSSSARDRVPSRWLAILAGCLALLIAGAVAPATTLNDEQPNLSGRWELNEEESDDLREKMMEARGSRGSRFGGGGFGGRGGMSGGRSGGSGGGRSPQGRFGGGQSRGGPSGREGESRLGIMRGIDVLLIEQNDSTLTIRYSDDSKRVLTTDGKKQESELPNGDSLVTTAKCKDGQLIVTVKSTERGKITESYKIADDGEHLLITLDLPSRGPRPAIQLNRVYDLAG